MNMKKTMAAIAAGAVAVSAMATTVSAINDTSFTYSLVETVKSQSVPTKTFTFTVNAPAPAAEVVATPDSYKVGNTAITETTTVHAAGAFITDAQYNALTAAQQANCAADATNEDSDATTTYKVTTAITTTTELHAAGATITAADYNALTDAQKALVVVTAGTPGSAAVEYPDYIDFGGWAVGPTDDKAFSVEKMVIKIQPSAAGEQNKTYTYSPNTANEGWSQSFVYNTVEGAYRLSFSDELANYTSALTISVTVETIDRWWNDTNKTNGTILAGGGVAADADGAPVTPVVYAGSGSNKTLAETVYLPFETNVKNNTNIIWFLDNALNLKGEGKGNYDNVSAVLNDAIANHQGVTFTFNTASSPVKYVVGLDSVADEHGKDFVNWDYATRFNTYEAAMVAGSNTVADSDDWDDFYVAAVYDDSDGCDKTYTTFAQHLYTTYYDPEDTTWTGFAWEGHNLFQGALIVNESLTMSLAQTDYFDWGKTSLTFDWDGIMDYSITENNYATYLHSMKLATSTRWYWDSMTVTFADEEAEDASSDAGVDGDGAELEETEEPSEEVEEPAEEPEVEEPAPAPAPEVANPTTGNASVALAVIPVALAAAAVVAKKRS